MHENENEFKDLGFNIKIWRRLLPYAFRNKKIAWFAGLSVVLCSVVDLAYSLMSKLAVDNYVTTGNMSGFLAPVFRKRRRTSPSKNAVSSCRNAPIMIS